MSKGFSLSYLGATAEEDDQQQNGWTQLHWQWVYCWMTEKMSLGQIVKMEIYLGSKNQYQRDAT